MGAPKGSLVHPCNMMKERIKPAQTCSVFGEQPWPLVRADHLDGSGKELELELRKSQPTVACERVRNSNTKIPQWNTLAHKLVQVCDAN